jgi:hypothetical protein
MLCNTCKINLPKEAFHKSSVMCKDCKNAWRLKTPTNYALTRYAMMKTRSTQKSYKVLGCTKYEFIQWSLSSNLPELLPRYKANSLSLLLRPEIDRCDWTLGYTIDNIQWLTHKEHMEKEKLNKGQIPIDLYTITGELIKSCLSFSHAAEYLGDSPSNIHKALQRTIVAVKGAIPCYKGLYPDIKDLKRCNMTSKALYWINKVREDSKSISEND